MPDWDIPHLFFRRRSTYGDSLASAAGAAVPAADGRPGETVWPDGRTGNGFGLPSA